MENVLRGPCTAGAKQGVPPRFGEHEFGFPISEGGWLPIPGRPVPRAAS